jgi:hypothetical protein
MARLGALHRRPVWEQGDRADSPPICFGINRVTLGLTMPFQNAIAMPSV